MGDNHEPVRSLARGLEVLKELNRFGAARVGTIAQRIKLPRSTVYRLLETLEGDGFVARSASDDRYRIAPRAATLFERYSSSWPVGSGLSRTALSDAGNRCPWLLHISTVINNELVICSTNRPLAPLVPWRGYIGRRLPLFHSSAGIAFFAFCNTEQRRALIRGHEQPADSEYVKNSVSAAASAGFAAYDDPSDPSLVSISTAIWSDASLVGCLTLVYIKDGDDKDSLLRLLMSEAERISSRAEG